jgi:hypothetical protein
MDVNSTTKSNEDVMFFGTVRVLYNVVSSAVLYGSVSGGNVILWRFARSLRPI